MLKGTSIFMEVSHSSATGEKKTKQSLGLIRHLINSCLCLPYQGIEEEMGKLQMSGYVNISLEARLC